MIDKALLEQTVDEVISGTDLFVVDIAVTPDNRIVVEIDSPSAVDIDTCAAITRRIEERFDRDVEDYELEVGSAGLTAPFKVRGQYLKNIGNEVEVLTGDGRKLRGVLAEVGDGDFALRMQRKVKPEGAKRPVTTEVTERLPFDGCKSVRYVLAFK